MLMRQRRVRFRHQLEAFEERVCPSGSTVVLPIASFVSQQGTTMLLTPPVPDQLAFTNSSFDPGTTSLDPNRLIMVDYTGRAAQYLAQHGINLNTKITGFITETAIGTSGRMEVSVNLEVTNALTWVAEVPTADLGTPAINTDLLELGYRAQDLVANPSLKPALSDAHFQITFQEQAGAPLPDLFQALTMGNAPPGFAPETVDFQSWGTGTLDAGTTVGTPGQTALVTTNHVADLTQPTLPGTLPDGFFQQAIDLVPVASPAASVTYLNGTLFITDLSNSNDNIKVNPATGGGVTVSSNLGNGTFANVNRVLVSLGGGNDEVTIGSLPGVTVNVSALDGNNTISIGNEAATIVSVGSGNNNISTGSASGTQQFFVGGTGNNTLNAGAGTTVVLMAGTGNNQVNAAGTGDFLEVVGNGNNHIQDNGATDLVWLGGDGNNTVVNQGHGSLSDILGSTGHNQISGPSAVGSSTFLVDPALTAGALTPPSPVAGVPITNAVLFHFTDADPAPNISDFTATVTWGDGSVETALVVADGHGFDVVGSHTYLAGATGLGFMVEVQDAGGAAPITASAAINVSGDVVVSGTAGDDVLTMMRTPSGPPGSITYVLNGAGPVVLNNINSFEFLGVGGNDSVTVSFANGAPLMTGSVLIDGGTGVSTLTIDAANLPVQTRPGNVLVGGQTVGYTAVEHLFINNAIAVNASVGLDTQDRATAFAGLSPAERAVQALYLDALGRPGSKAELDVWVAVMPPGATALPLAVVSGIEDSTEAFDHLVQSWFLNYLGRPALSAEEPIFVSLLTSGDSEEQVLSFILGSQEFYARAQSLISSGTADERFVQALFLELLGRTGSPSEVAQIVNQLSQVGNGAVALIFLQSQEFRTIQFEGYFNSLLHRPDEPGDAPFLSGLVQSSIDIRDARFLFETSAEFFTNG
jgi:hypothetical protein